MRLQLSLSYDNLSLVEAVWVFVALLVFSGASMQGLSIAAGLALISFSFLQRTSFTGRPSRPTVFDLSWALLLLGALIGLMVSYDASQSLPVVLMLLASLALYYVAANTYRPMVLAQMALLAGLVVAVYYLVQYQYIPHAEKSAWLSSLGSFTSGFFPRLGSWEPFSNGVATLLEGLIPLGIALMVTYRSRAWRAISGAATGVMALAVLVAASRGAWVALLAAILLGLASRRKQVFIVLILAALAGFVALGGYLLLVENAALQSIPLIGPLLYQLFARPDRLEVYQGSLRLIQDFPFSGIGQGNVFAMIYSQYVLLIRHAFLTYSHNLYLTIWLEHGLLGIIGACGMAVALARLVIRGSRKKAGDFSLFQGAWVGAVAILIHGLFDARQYVDLWAMWPLFLLLGLAVATASIKDEKKTGGTLYSRRWAWAALLLVIGLGATWRPLAAMAWSNWGAIRQIKAELIADLPQDTREAHLRASVAGYNRALKLNLNNRTANLRLGNLAVTAGRYDEGIAHLETVWRASPEDPTACKALGLAYAWEGRIDEAAELLRNTKDIVAELNTWGGWHRSEGRRQVAANAYRTSLALEPDQPQVQESLSKLEDK